MPLKHRQRPPWPLAWAACSPYLDAVDLEHPRSPSSAGW